MSKETRKVKTFRILPSELTRIEEAAKQYRLNWSDYMIRSALGTLPSIETTDERFEAVERRLERLEELASL